MGKASRNEQRKLIATFWNNIAVGVMVTGFLVPYWAVYRTLTSNMHSTIPDLLKSLGLGETYWPLAAPVAAVFISYMLNWWAIRCLRAVED